MKDIFYLLADAARLFNIYEMLIDIKYLSTIFSKRAWKNDLFDTFK